MSSRTGGRIFIHSWGQGICKGDGGTGGLEGHWGPGARGAGVERGDPSALGLWGLGP